ncbi:MAG: ribosome-associated heat shock protein Hsp15 [Gammaproteobacteria bacterium]
MTASDSPDDKIRLDKWLWAARFYKTRSLAKDMIDGGKVHYEGQRVKPSKEVTIGATIRLRQGTDEKIVVVTGLSGKRGNATQAAALYRETDDSIAAREQAAANRKALGPSFGPGHQQRPNKKQRRNIIQFRQQQNDSHE